MKHYKVVALTISGPGRKIYRAKDVVAESELIPETIPGYLKGGSIVKATDADVKKFKKLQEMSEEDRLNANAKEAEEAEKTAKAERDKAVKEYVKVTGISEDKVDKTWPTEKIIAETKAADDKKKDQAEEYLAKLVALDEEYKKLAGDKAEETNDWDIKTFEEKIAALKAAS